MNFLKDFKELYYHELEHSDRLNKKISTNLTILTILGTGETFIWKSIVANSQIPLDYSKMDYSLTILCIISLLSLIAFFVSIVLFIKAYFGYKYEYFPILGCKKYIDKLQLLKTKKGKTNSTIASKAAHKYNDIPNTVKKLYLRCAINNRKQNIKKNHNQRNEDLFLIITLLSETVVIIYSLIFTAYIYYK